MTINQQLITEAVIGDRGPDQQRIAVAGLEWIDLILRKNSDYGTSVWQPPPLKPNLDPGDAILVRMGDKVNRINQLTQRPPEVADESLADTIRDLGAYCLLWLARPKNGKDST